MKTAHINYTVKQVVLSLNFTLHFGKDKIEHGGLANGHAVVQGHCCEDWNCSHSVMGLPS